MMAKTRKKPEVEKIPIPLENPQDKNFREWDENRKPLDLPLVYRAFPGRVLSLDTHGIREQGLSRTIDLAWKEIKSIQWGFTSIFGHSSRRLFVRIISQTGQMVNLCGYGKNLPEIYLNLHKAWRKALGGRLKKDETPIHYTEEKLSKNLWRAALAGVLWVVIPGLFSPKVQSELTLLVFGVLPALVMIAVLVWALKRETIVIRDESPRQEVPPAAAFMLIVLAFLSSYGLIAFASAKLGQWEIKLTKARFAAAGYDIQIPANSPAIPDKDNGAYYLMKAEEAPSPKLSAEKKNVLDWDKPFIGKRSQYDLLVQLMEDMQKGPLSSEDEGLALQLLAARQDGIRLLEAAERAKGFDWGMDFTVKPSFLIDTPQLPNFLNWDRLLTVKAYLQAKQGRGKDAVETLRTCLFLGKAAFLSKTLLGQMVGAACEKITLTRASLILSKIPASLLEKELLPALETKGMVEAFKASEEFGLYARWNWKEQFRWSFVEPFELHDLARLYAYRLQKLEIMKLPYSKQKTAQDQADAAYRRSPWSISEDIITPDFNYQNKVLEAVAEARLASATIKARLFHLKTHRWPVQVKPLALITEDEFLDPFSDGEPLKITAKGTGVQFSSLGPDEWDGNGKPLGRRALAWFVEKE